MTQQRHLHASGKWSAPDTTFARYLAQCIEAGDATRLTTTESKGMLPEIRKALGSRWDLDLRGEFIVGTHRDHGALRNGWLAKLTNRFGGSDDWRNARAHCVNVDTDHGTELVMATHLSSAVQAGAHWSGFAPGVASHRDSTDRLSLIRGNQRPKRVTLGADVNLDLHRWVWRRYMAASLGMEGCWDDRDQRPDGGTHGRRLIDGVWSTAPIERARIVRAGVVRPKVLDHAAVLAVVGKRGPVDHGTLTPLGGDR